MAKAASVGVTAEEEAITAAGVLEAVADSTTAAAEVTPFPVAPLPFVVPPIFLLISCNFFDEAEEELFRLLEERLDSVVGTASPLLPFEAMEGGEEGMVVLGVEDPVELS